MKQKLWMVLATVGLLILASCGSDDDKRESLPWNSKELFDATYTMNDEGCYVLKDVVSPPEENMLEILKETNLVKAMDKIYVSHVVIRDSKKEQCKARFKHLPDDVDVVMTWKDYPESDYGWNDYTGTEMVLVLKRDKEQPQKVTYYVHAEPAK